MDAGIVLLIFFGLIGFSFYILLTALIQWVAVMMMGSQAGYLTAVKVQLVTVLVVPFCMGAVLVVLMFFLGSAITVVAFIAVFAYLVFICKYMMEAYGIGFFRLFGSWLLVMFFNAGLTYLSAWGLMENGYSAQEINRVFDFSQYFK